MIIDKNGHIFVCGDVTMASEVSKTLTNLLQEYAAFSDEEAKNYVTELRVSIVDKYVKKFFIKHHIGQNLGYSFVIYLYSISDKLFFRYWAFSD